MLSPRSGTQSASLRVAIGERLVANRAIHQALATAPIGIEDDQHLLRVRSTSVRWSGEADVAQHSWSDSRIQRAAHRFSPARKNSVVQFQSRATRRPPHLTTPDFRHQRQRSAKAASDGLAAPGLPN